MIASSLTRFFRWVFDAEGLRSDLRASFVGALVSGVLVLLSGVYAAAVNMEFTGFLNDAGYVTPMPGLVRMLGREDGTPKVSFEPQNLERVAICEYAYVTGQSAREIFFSYLDRYSMCLDLVQIKGESFVVRPNLRSGQLTQKGGDYLCKCQQQ